MKTSIINSLTDKELQSLLDSSDSYVDVLKNLGLDPYSGNHRTLKSRIKASNLEIKSLTENREKAKKLHFQNLASKTKLSAESILVEDCNKSGKSLRRLLLRDNLIEYKCAECGIQNIYNNKDISLQLDHINGVNNDNRLENLRWLCPNCHSQTETFSGRNSRKNFQECKICGKSVGKECTYCKTCLPSTRLDTNLKVDWPEVKDLIVQIRTTSYLATAKSLGVSDNAVRAHLRRRGVNLRTVRGRTGL